MSVAARFMQAVTQHSVTTKLGSRRLKCVRAGAVQYARSEILWLEGTPD